MAEAATIDRVKSRKVQVASLPPADSGRGFARLPDKLMDELSATCPVSNRLARPPACQCRGRIGRFRRSQQG